MGECHSKASKLYRSGGGKQNDEIKPLKSGEKAEVRMPPNWLNKEGEIIVAKDENGKYIYKVGFDKTDYKIDTNSDEYKAALRAYNIFAKFSSDGKVTVNKGGLFAKKRTFKTIEEFSAEADKKINALIKYHESKAEATKQGRISQIESELLKGWIRDDTPNALTRMNKQMKKSLMSSRTQAAAGKDMKERLSKTVSDARKNVK